MNLKKRRHGPHHALICNKFDASSFQRRLACNQFVYMDLVQKKACKKTIDQPYQIFCDAFISFFLSFFLFSLSKDIRNLVDFQSYLDDNRKPRISASSNLSASIGEKKKPKHNNKTGQNRISNIISRLALVWALLMLKLCGVSSCCLTCAWPISAGYANEVIMSVCCSEHRAYGNSRCEQISSESHDATRYRTIPHDVA
ncbi:hypothetical protein RRG08_040690 [Elysia crispata]|uniref:Uncharacterized protein n=1 Tax=Elysia crispata TaxID=231223 RepID=A0AAE1AXL1_9GAST|nr:hypothetical protein RRG08_040690 [Elysia crispata]